MNCQRAERAESAESNREGGIDCRRNPELCNLYKEGCTDGHCGGKACRGGACNDGCINCGDNDPLATLAKGSSKNDQEGLKGGKGGEPLNPLQALKAEIANPNPSATGIDAINTLADQVVDRGLMSEAKLDKWLASKGYVEDTSKKGYEDYD